MVYHIVEPHADDAFLSLHSHIVQWKAQGSRVRIHTITGPMKRLLEAAKYAEAVGAEHIGYSVEDVLPLDWSKKLEGVGKGDQVILPLSIKHPTHTAVREALETRLSWFYVDQPYAITQSSSAAATDLLRGLRVVSYIKPHARKYKHIGTFKSQAKFFHFNPVEKLKETFEMVVSR